jgi:glutathione peroxidase
MVARTRILFANIFSWISYHLLNTRREAKGSVYDFQINSLSGKPVRLEIYRGRKMLIVNTASKCGYTPQLKDLQVLHEKYGNRVAILGFPANDFLWQEPGSNQDIAEFCNVNYGVTFQMFSKVSVKGRHMHPLFRWLEAKTGRAPAWNFAKYLIDEEGEVKQFFQPNIKPLDQKIIDKILQ